MEIALNLVNISIARYCAINKSPGSEWDQEKVQAEKSLNRRKSRTFFLSNFFPPNFFLSHIELEVLQRWQTTNFKAYSKLHILKNGITKNHDTVEIG